MILIFLLGGTQLAQAAVIDIPPSPTSMTSTTKRMISYRNQKHSWQTSDGALHIMVNVGTVPNSQALTLYSSFDNGVTYTPEFTLPKTNGFSTSDGILGNAVANSNVLQIVYGTESNDPEIMYVTAAYDSTTQTWTLGTPQLVYAAKGQLSSMPAFNVDSAGNLWVCYTVEVIATGLYSLQMSYQLANTSTWVQSGLTFGVTDNIAQHAGRPVPLPNGIGMVFQDDTTLYWSYWLNSQPLNAPWATQVLYTGLPPAGNDPYGTHFNVAADAGNNLFLIFAENTGALGYLMYSNTTGTWGNVQNLTSTSYVVTYMQVVIADGDVVLIANDKTSLVVFQSTDGGATFKLTQVLTHTPATGTDLDYNNPRVEAPTYCTSPIPTWQQFFDPTTQYLNFYSVPVLVAGSDTR
jgi:hypothetical protein